MISLVSRLLPAQSVENLYKGKHKRKSNVSCFDLLAFQDWSYIRPAVCGSYQFKRIGNVSNCRSAKWLILTMYTWYNLLKVQRAQKGTEDIWNPLDFFNLRRLSRCFILSPQQMFIFCQESKGDIYGVLKTFSSGYSCEGKHMTWMTFCCIHFSFISPLLVEVCKYY